MDDIGGLIGGLIAIVIIVYIVAVIMMYVALAFAAVGAAYGLIMAVINFFRSQSDVIAYRSALKHCKDQETLEDIEKELETPTKLIHYTKNYEEIASPSYFLGPCFGDVKLIISQAVAYNFASKPEFDRGEEWYTRIFFFIYALFKLVALYVLGTIFTLGLSLMFVVLFVCCGAIIYPIMFLVFLGEKMYYKRNKISMRCPKCKNSYTLPIYACPNCGIRHTNLCPGKFGIGKRKCVCGTILPLTANRKGLKFESDYTTGNVTRKKFGLSEMDAYCPQCGTQHNAALTHPIGIALIGGASAGKTTFKVAFLNDFIDNELVKFDADCDFLNEDTEREFKEMEKQYAGRPIPATATGIDTDISAFSFSVRHKKLDIDRIIQLFDMPGEVFQKGDAKEGWNMYQFNEGAVFLLDPYTLSKVQEENEKELKDASMGVSKMRMDALVESLINTMEGANANRSRSKRFKLPVALTINKVDTPMLKKQVGDEAVQALMKAHPDVFTEYFATMDYACRCFLAKKEGAGFIANLDNHFETVHFFSSSPMGYVPKGVLARFRPINVLPIMQWMMVRTDKQLGKIWNPENPVPDLTEEQRNLYCEHREYYDDYINSIAV